MQVAFISFNDISLHEPIQANFSPLPTTRIWPIVSSIFFSSYQRYFGYAILHAATWAMWKCCRMRQC